MGKPHAVVIPFPAQGHVIPHMELSFWLANCGFKITFINTEFNHKRIMDSFSNDEKECPIHLISIPDGLETDEDQNDIGKLSNGMKDCIYEKLEEIITKINETDDGDDVVTCVISDMIWALKVAEKMGIQRRVAFSVASAALVALSRSIPMLIKDGIIDSDGALNENQTFQLSLTMPVMNTANLIWNCFGDSTTNKLIFHSMQMSNGITNLAHCIVCNSSYELEPGAFTLFPHILPIGPLLASNRLGRSSGHFWPEDSTCLNWLDQQPPRSVIYVAFGSFTVFEQIQFQELASGLQLSRQRFLWVTRPGTCTLYPNGFQSNVSTHGRIIGWAPQQLVLSHPSIACFLSHCGWNSTMEGVSNGIPFLCWPYFADQFLNQDYICDVWETGLRLNKDENGIISKNEISEKINRLLDDEGIKTRALKLKETVGNSLQSGGSSSKSFDDFVKGIK